MKSLNLPTRADMKEVPENANNPSVLPLEDDSRGALPQRFAVVLSFPKTVTPGEAIRRLRFALKALGRQHGIRAESIEPASKGGERGG